MVGKTFAFFLLFVVVVAVAQAQAQTQEAQAFLSAINAHRLASPVCWDGRKLRAWPQNGGARELSLSPTLSQAASNHNVAMATQGCSDHTCAGELPLPQRAIAAGYPPRWDFLSENIAGGFETATDVLAAWQRSPGHNKNMLSCAARVVGVARLYDPNTPVWWYWTTDFGDVIDAVTPTPTRRPLGEALDLNQDHVLGDDEVLTAIAYWVQGTPVPGSNALIDDEDILNLITLWVTGTRL